VREAAKRDGKLRFTALLHHVTIELLRDSYSNLKRKATPGVDGVTWEEYGRDLEGRLKDLYGRIHRGAYRALPITKSLDPEKRWKATTIGNCGDRGREAGSERSVEQRREPMNKNRIVRPAVRSEREHRMAKLISIQRTGGKSGGCAPQAVELTSGDLPLLSNDWERRKTC